MGNFKHYLNALSTGESFFSLDKKLTVIFNSLAIYNILLAVLFCIIEVYPLMILSALSVAMYFGICDKYVRSGRIQEAVVFSTTEVLIYTLIATICVGTNCGFSFYCIGMISAAFYLAFVVKSFKNNEFVSLVYSIITFISFFVCYFWSGIMEPLYVLPSNAWYHVFYILNSTASFTSVIIFNFLFIWEIKANQQALASRNEQLDVMANHDPLTHLLNRRCMNNYLEESMQTLRLRGKRFSLILCDIDDFKKVNDTYGHDAGDEILVRTSEIITGSLRDGDVVCRWGGEEILIKINDPGDIAYKAAERIRQKIENNIVTYTGQKISITMTFGIAESIPGYKLDQLIQQADNKLYQGKKQGKNVVIF